MVIAERKSSVDLVILDTFDYDAMVEMDFLTKYGATTNCKVRTVNFKPLGKDQSEFNGKECEELKLQGLIGVTISA